MPLTTKLPEVLLNSIVLRPNKKISVFRVTGLKILAHIFFFIFFSGKKYNFVHFERHFAFQNAKYYIFSIKPEKNSRLPQ